MLHLLEFELLQKKFEAIFTQMKKCINQILNKIEVAIQRILYS